MTRHKNLLILFFCSMCFVRGICKAMWSAIKVLN